MSALSLVVIGCGSIKRDERSRAAELYRGSYFRSCFNAAAAIAPPSRIRILSALHGLVELDRELDPYDMTLGHPEAVTAPQIVQQAIAQQIAGLPVLALCAARYAGLLRAAAELGAFPEVSAPLAGLGIGQQRGELRRISVHRRLW